MIMKWKEQNNFKHWQGKESMLFLIRSPSKMYTYQYANNIAKQSQSYEIILYVGFDCYPWRFVSLGIASVKIIYKVHVMYLRYKY